ncbi:membrane-spanning 4-domains subfamily A member 12-like [Tupaia chinensis]|uniref:membrane-spanning 4-domains subfamily A member 12-like n=1 Tax=Tupaia chinensis TaxID=246437 RepID=UPI0003C8E2C0|nr:membrane-spanning 4-domains subfamily A member 12-like [Tupaia chinensis]XP_006163880.1 membrane-spanning 4-domains subfamily A member 12-like [Tupaia chinensis]XP_006163881.1 membrane-spanning 4-domains subfamily A member 12-like [Tupaia chinensis]
MSTPHIVLKEEARMLGATQVMIGLIHCALGQLWTYLYVNHYDFFSSVYLPLVFLSGYPFWSCIIFIISGIFTIEVEKHPSRSLLMYTVWMNLSSFIATIIGIFLILFEIIYFLAKQVKEQWPHQSGILLTTQLWIFSILEMFLTSKVTKWGKKVFYTGNKHL